MEKYTKSWSGWNSFSTLNCSRQSIFTKFFDDIAITFTDQNDRPLEIEKNKS